jgi:hypothetical protein
MVGLGETPVGLADVIGRRLAANAKKFVWIRHALRFSGALG